MVGLYKNEDILFQPSKYLSRNISSIENQYRGLGPLEKARRGDGKNAERVGTEVVLGLFYNTSLAWVKLVR